MMNFLSWIPVLFFLSCSIATPVTEQELRTLGFGLMQQLKSFNFIEDGFDSMNVKELIETFPFREKEQFDLLVEISRYYKKWGKIVLPKDLSIHECHDLVKLADFFQIEAFGEIFIASFEHIWRKTKGIQRIKSRIPLFGRKDKVFVDSAFSILQNMFLIADAKIPGIEFSSHSLIARGNQITFPKNLTKVMKILDFYKCNLKRIYISDVDFDPFLLGKLMKNSENLESLILHNNNLSHAVDSLPFKGLLNLKFLQLTNNGIQREHLANIFALMKNPNNSLEHLDLSKNDLSAILFKMLSMPIGHPFVGRNYQIISLNPFLISKLHLGNLKILNLSDCIFYPNSIWFVRKFLSQAANIESLFLLGDDSFQYDDELINIIGKLKNIRKLTLQNFSFENQKYFFQTLNKLPLEHLALDFVDVEGISLLPSKLESLKILSPRVPEKFLSTLRSLQRKNQLNLKELDLSCCKMQNDSLEQLKDYLESASIHSLEVNFKESNSSPLIRIISNLLILTIKEDLSIFSSLFAFQTLQLDSLMVIGDYCDEKLIHQFILSLKSSHRIVFKERSIPKYYAEKLIQQGKSYQISTPEWTIGEKKEK